MGILISQLITVTCRQWSELWLFTVQGKQELEMQPFALSLLKTESFSCLKCKRQSSKEGTMCVRWILERCELLANSIFDPPQAWSCGKCYNLPEGGGKGSHKIAAMMRCFHGLQNKHIPFYLYAANILISGFIAKCTCVGVHTHTDTQTCAFTHPFPQKYAIWMFMKLKCCV